MRYKYSFVAVGVLLAVSTNFAGAANYLAETDGSGVVDVTYSYNNADVAVINAMDEVKAEGESWASAPERMVERRRKFHRTDKIRIPEAKPIVRDLR